MISKSKILPLIILGTTAILGSRALFFFFDDPEGPNLLIVAVTAAIVYCLSLSVYLVTPSSFDSKRFWVATALQLALVLSLYFLGVTF